MPRAGYGNSDSRKDLHQRSGSDNLRLDAGAVDQEVDLGPRFIVLQRRRDKAYGSQTAILALDQSALGMISISPHPKRPHKGFSFAVSRDGEHHVQISSGPRLGPQYDRETSNESPLRSNGLEVRIQPDQSFLEAGHRRASELLSRCGRFNVGPLLHPSREATANLLLARLWMPAAEVLPHDVLGGLAEIEGRSGSGEGLGVVNRLHALHSTMVPRTCAGLPSETCGLAEHRQIRALHRRGMRLDRRNCATTDPAMMSTAEVYVTTAGSARSTAGNFASTDPAVMSTAEVYVSTAGSVVTTATAVETPAECALRPIRRWYSPPRRWRAPPDLCDPPSRRWRRRPEAQPGGCDPPECRPTP